MKEFWLALGGNVIIGAFLLILWIVLRYFLERIKKYLDYIIALTIGILLGILLVGFMPEFVSSDIEGRYIGLSIFTGILIFYVIELFLHFHHCKDLMDCGCTERERSMHEHSYLINIGTLFHNMLHGLVLYAGFAVSFKLGVSLIFAVLLHSIPQNTVNYILNRGKSTSIVLASMGGVIGVLLLFPFREFILGYKVLFLGVLAGGLLYIALGDMFPHFKEKGSFLNKGFYLFFVVLGFLLNFLFF